MDAAWRTAAAIAKNFVKKRETKISQDKQFKGTKKRHIYTFFKNADIKTGSARRENPKSLWAFQDKVKRLELSDRLRQYRTPEAPVPRPARKDIGTVGFRVSTVFEQDVRGHGSHFDDTW